MPDTELEKLKKYLDEHDYDNVWNTILSTNDQIIVYGPGHFRSWDAVCHKGSYGGDQGLLEIYGNICTDVIGWLKADDVIKILKYMAKKGPDWAPIDSMDDIKED